MKGSRSRSSKAFSSASASALVTASSVRGSIGVGFVLLVVLFAPNPPVDAIDESWVVVAAEIKFCPAVDN